VAEGSDARYDFVEHVNDHLHDALRQADLKAMAALAVSVAMLGVCLLLRSHRAFTSLHADAVEMTLGLSSYALLLLAFGTSVFVIFPRLAKDPPKGWIFWESIAAHGPGEYAASLEAATPETMRKALAEHNAVASRILIQKYSWLRVTWFAVSLGTVLAAATMVLIGK
jgi:hypothetical protein